MTFMWNADQDVLVNIQHIIKLRIAAPYLNQRCWAVVADLANGVEIMHRAESRTDCERWMAEVYNNF